MRVSGFLRVTRTKHTYIVGEEGLWLNSSEQEMFVVQCMYLSHSSIHILHFCIFLEAYMAVGVDST